MMSASSSNSYSLDIPGYGPIGEKAIIPKDEGYGKMISFL